MLIQRTNRKTSVVEYRPYPTHFLTGKNRTSNNSVKVSIIFFLSFNKTERKQFNRIKL